MKNSADAARGKSKNAKSGAGNKENVNEEFEDESDDERSSDDGDESDIEKYFNLDAKTPQHVANAGESSTAVNMNKLLNSRRYATPGMSSHYVVNPFFSSDDNNISNSNNNVSSSSCSTPTSIYPPATASSTTSTNQTKTNKRDLTSYDSNPSASQPATPKKSNLSGAESDTSDRCINRFSNRTKLFLSSFLKFKRSLRVKRRNSNSCSDLFVIWKSAQERKLFSFNLFPPFLHFYIFSSNVFATTHGKIYFYRSGLEHKSTGNAIGQFHFKINFLAFRVRNNKSEGKIGDLRSFWKSF